MKLQLPRSRNILIISLVIILFIAWRMLIIGMSEHYVVKALAGDTKAIDSALSWNSGHPKAQYLKASQIWEKDPDTAESLLRESIISNPTDARPLQLLAFILNAKGETEQADVLVDQSTLLMPAKKSVRLNAANYWIQRSQWGKALDNWRAALTTDPSLGEDVFPLLLKIAENQEARPILKQFIEDPPPWWDKFFAYLTENAIDPETSIAIATMRHASKAPISADERKYLVRRLMKEQQWPGAYLVWVNGLDKSQQAYLGSLYNGGFELEPSNEGFDWHVQKIKGVNVKRQKSYGITGKKALHINYTGRELRYKHLYQPLFLNAGAYEFHADIRTDRLTSRGGLKWAVYCAGAPDKVLGESERLMGSGEWQQRKFNFTVHESAECSGQVLRLESTGRTTFDHKLEGDIWFDRMGIRSTGQEPVEPAVLYPALQIKPIAPNEPLSPMPEKSVDNKQ